MGVCRIAGFGLTTGDAARLVDFFVTALGARVISSGRREGPRFERCFGVRGGARRHTVALGDQEVEILEFDTPGRPYPDPLPPEDTAFQHFALVVSDMEGALGRLRSTPGWKAISSGGPQHLPQRSGGVTAFKFRDPDGHPLELLAFPPSAAPARWQERSAQGIVLGIDHSAISVRDTAHSVAFYEGLGFRLSGQTWNHGGAQAHLDGIAQPEVEVTALSPVVLTPHLELLCYRSGARAIRTATASNDVAATRMALAIGDSAGPGRLTVDPDGHHLLLIPRGEPC